MDFNILGVGPAEMILIFLIALIFLGPKRMMAWTYQAGKYTARFRAQFGEMMAAVRKEFEAAQIDLPKDMSVPRVPRSRFDIVKEANKLVNAELNKPASGAATSATSASAASSAPAATAGAAAGAAAKTASDNGRAPAPQGASQNNPPAAVDGDNDTEARYDAWLPK
jgi:Sec-independent protein translocase protein TatA